MLFLMLDSAHFLDLVLVCVSMLDSTQFPKLVLIRFFTV